MVQTDASITAVINMSMKAYTGSVELVPVTGLSVPVTAVGVGVSSSGRLSIVSNSQYLTPWAFKRTLLFVRMKLLELMSCRNGKKYYHYVLLVLLYCYHSI